MANFSLTPPPELPPSDWAEENIMISVGNARPGLISFTDVTYQRAMIDIGEDPNIQRITFMLGAQTGKTMTSLSMLGYYTMYKPRSQIVMMPSENDLDVWLDTKFNPMVDSNPDIKNCYAKPRGREGVNNKLMKSFKGGWLMFAWAGSPNTARGKSAPIIICDEVDGYKYTAEGHPVDLLWERSATFGEDRLIMILSTPTIRGKSYVESSFSLGDQRYFFIVCSECGHKHRIIWSEQSVRWKEGEPETARLHCPKCDYGANDYERIAMIRNAEKEGGGWEASKPTRNHASFHLNSLYSPLRRLSDIVEVYELGQAKNDLQTFTNTILAEAWEETGEKGDHEALYSRAEIYEAEVPDGVLILTAGADVQADRIEYEVVGWGEGEESWSIDYQVVYGDTTQLDVYKEFFQEIKRPYKTINNEQVGVTGVGIDSGYNTGKVYEALRYAGRSPMFFALKGKGGMNTEEVRRTSRAKIERGKWRPEIITVGVDVIKRTVMRRLNLHEHGPGYSHFPDDRDLDYFLQLTSEIMITTHKAGYANEYWEKKYERNEALDCRVYAYATLRVLSPKLDKDQGLKTKKEKKRELRKLRNPHV